MKLKNLFLLQGENYHRCLEDKKEILLKIGDKLYIPHLDTLNLEYRKKFYKFICDIEKEYGVSLIDVEEKFNRKYT